MAVSTRTMTRRRDYSRLFIALAVLAGVIALAPIAGAVIGLSGTTVGPKTAFASAPAGEYAVVGRSEATMDVISVVRSDSPETVTEVARVPHIQGFTSTGAVSPDGKRLALVSVDGGSPSHPLAGLNVVDLESARIVRAAENLVPGQTPVWTSDGKALVFTRMPAGNESQGAIHVVQVARDGGDERVLRTFDGVLGVYPAGFDGDGKLVTVVLGGDGSLAYREGRPAVVLAPNLTRDWKLSPDGATIAFVEVDAAAGVRYFARTARLDGAGGAEQASLVASVSALGAAWNPATNAASFGVEPGSESGAVKVQALTAAGAGGFDVPLAYSESGKALVVTHWSGGSFQEPGRPQLQLVVGSDRSSYEQQTRFFGWASR